MQALSASQHMSVQRTIWPQSLQIFNVTFGPVESLIRNAIDVETTPVKVKFKGFLCAAVPPSRSLSASPDASPRGPSPAPATAANAADRAADRAVVELAEFQDRQLGGADDEGNDIDPDAPAAMKDSPSVSGEEGNSPASTTMCSCTSTNCIGHDDHQRHLIMFCCHLCNKF